MLLDEVYRTSRTLSIPNGELCYVEKGTGPALLLLHGIPLSLLTWRHNLEELGRSQRAIAVDLRGFGRSSKGPGDYSPAGHAGTLAAAADALGLTEVDLVASSYGCAPALRLAVDRPNLVRRLVLINSVGCAGNRHSLERLVRIGVVAAGVRRLLRSASFGRRLFAARLAASYARPEGLEPGLVDAYLALLRRDGGEVSFLATLRQFDEGALGRLLPEVAQPSLVVWGGADPILPLAAGERLRRAIPNSRWVQIDGAGHLPHEEAPAAFHRAVLDFLAEGNGRRPRENGRAGQAEAGRPGVRSC